MLSVARRCERIRNFVPIGIDLRPKGNNLLMAKIIDLVTIAAVVFLLTLVWATLLFDRWAGAIIFAAGITAVVVFTVVYIKKRRYHPYHPDRLAAELCVRGDEYLVNLLKTAADNENLEYGEDYVKNGDTVWFAAFRFVKFGTADLCARLRRAEKMGASRAVILARSVDRRAFGAAKFFSVKVSVVRTRALYAFLAKRRALPPLERHGAKFSMRALVAAALSRGNLRNYLFSGVVLVSVSFLTPLKIYYLVFGSISLLMALLTLTPLSEGKSDGDGSLAGLLKNECEYVRDAERSDGGTDATNADGDSAKSGDADGGNGETQT